MINHQHCIIVGPESDGCGWTDTPVDTIRLSLCGIEELSPTEQPPEWDQHFWGAWLEDKTHRHHIDVVGRCGKLVTDYSVSVHNDHLTYTCAEHTLARQKCAGCSSITQESGLVSA